MGIIRTLLFLACLAALELPSTATAWAAPDERTIRLDIPQQPLIPALTEFARQTSLQLLYQSSLAEKRTSNPVSGHYTPQRALEILLSGSGIHYRFVDDNVVTLESAENSGFDSETLLAAAGEFVVADADVSYRPDNRPVAQEDLTVRGQALSGYTTLHTRTPTKTDTPLLETPVAVQIVPKTVMQDQQATRIKDALENVSSVRPQSTLGRGNGFIIRGFRNGTIYRNGLIANGLSIGGATEIDTANLESVEVLKGPAAVLFGRIEPGGLVNIVTKRPETTDKYSLEQRFGSYDFYRTEWDATGNISDSEFSYRFSGSYQNTDSFRDFNFKKRFLLNPSLTWKPDERTEINLEIEALDQEFQVDRALFAIGESPAPIPIERSFIDPNDPTDTMSRVNLGFDLTHEFDDNWALHNRFLASFIDSNDISVKPANAFTVQQFLDPSSGNRTYLRNIFSQIQDTEVYTTNLDLTGRFNTADIQHQILVGFDFLRATGTYWTRGDYINPVSGLEIDIFDPVYGIDSSFYSNALTMAVPAGGNYSYFRDQWYGVYFQDHITLWERLHILGGGRYDWATTGRGRAASFAAAEAVLPSREDEGFSPRVGVLYQPTDWLSLYGNWTTSFGANNGVTDSGATVDPEIGEQYEAGFKTALFDSRLTASLAYYHLTKQNVLTRDFNSSDPSAVAPIGEARSQGIELDISGALTDSLSIIGNYAFTDARITQDNRGQQGNRLNNVPEHSGSLWLKYDVTDFEPLNGWSFGIGMFAASQREGDDANSFNLPGYVRLDAFTAYRQQLGDTRLIAQFNVRNLLDKTYYESTDPFLNAPPRVGIYPGAPLTATGTIRLEF